MGKQIGFRDIVRRRSKRHCEICSKQTSYRNGNRNSQTIHHRFPKRNGKDDRPSNLMWLCWACHEEIHRDEDWAAMRGYIVRGEPGDSPVLLHRTQWALLGVDGSVTPLPAHLARGLIEQVERLRDNPHLGVA